MRLVRYLLHLYISNVRFMHQGDHFKHVQPKLLSSEDKEHIHVQTVRKGKQPHKLDNAGLQCKYTLT